MANRTESHGLTHDVKKKLAARDNEQEEKEAMEWMEKLIGEDFYTESGAKSVQGYLKDGVRLCKLANALQAGAIPKITDSKMAFKQMENISNFLAFSANYGLQSTDSFQTVDLYENQNMTQVIMTITALGRHAQLKGFNGPTLGPKEASKNVREFDQETIDKGKAYVSTQYGYTGGANQSGQNFGKTRKIID
uniref:Myophilin n=1 Tax=Salmo salar TaxID=8030 RepID=B5X687_SALSA|nr:Myophilin [Salmo salar]ACI66357.1 Myophilin [Salmo salar]